MTVSIIKKLAVSAVAVFLLAGTAAAQTWDCGKPGYGTNQHTPTSAVKCALVDGVLTVSGTGAMIDMPSSTTVNSQGTRISYQPPWYESDIITSVIIEDGVTHIGAHAFFGLSNLTSVTISNSVKSIGFYAFAFSKSLTTITIPASVTNIGSAFRANTSLKHIISLNPIPPKISIEKKLSASACLQVPASSIAAYQKAGGWKAFKCIEAIK